MMVETLCILFSTEFWTLEKRKEDKGDAKKERKKKKNKTAITSGIHQMVL